MTTKTKNEAPSKEKEVTSSSNDEGDSSVKIPEQFQKDVYRLIEQCNNVEQVEFICTCAGQKRTEIYEKENPKEEEFSSEGMPS